MRKGFWLFILLPAIARASSITNPTTIPSSLPASLPLPGGDTSYIQNNPASEQTASYNVASGTIHGPLSLSAPSTGYLLMLNSSNQVSTTSWTSASGVINVMNPPYNATGNGSTDDTAAIQAAVTAGDGNMVFFPIGTYKISSAINVPTNTYLKGIMPIAASSGTIISQTSSSAPIFLLADSGNGGALTQNVTIDGFELLGGSASIKVPNGGVWMTFNNINAGATGIADLYLKGYINNLNVSNWDVVGAEYGIYLYENGDNGSIAAIQGSNFTNLYINGQSANNIDMDVSVADGGGYGVSFTNVQLITSQQDGAIFAGFTSLTLNNISMEGDCAGQSGVIVGTATTTASSAVVSVSSPSVVNGSTITIKGAGTNGTDWYPVVQSGGGTTSLTMTTTAPTAVTQSEWTNALYSIVKFYAGNNPTNSNNVTIINPLLESPSDGWTCRYAIDGSNVYNVSILNPETSSRPIYDPNLTFTVLGANDHFLMRQPSSLNADTFNTQIFGGTGAPRTQVVSPPGNNLLMGLQDSNSNATGSYGNWSVNKLDSSRDYLLFLNGTSGNFGIGTSSPGQKFEVNGAAQIDGNLYSTGGQTIVGGGNLSSPSIGFNGNTNTGIYTPATNTVGIDADGAEVCAMAPSVATFYTNLGFSPTTDGIVGTTAGDNASAGNVGEYMNSAWSGVAVTSNASGKSTTSLTLTAGDWDVWSSATMNVNGVTPTFAELGISTTQNSGNLGNGAPSSPYITIASGGTINLTAYERIDIGSSTTYYTNQSFNYTGTAPQSTGAMWARRMR